MEKVTVDFPDVMGLSQDEEWCRVSVNGSEPRTIRFHEYGEIFNIPGLYEELFYSRLGCASPQTLAAMLKGEIEKGGVNAADLRGLDLGAGNGMVGEELRKLGVASLIGVDILPEAAAAAKRDRPSVYQDYVVADLTALGDADRMRLTANDPNLLVTVAALGFGDMPSPAFATAWNLLATPSWVVFNIKQDFLSKKYQHGFSLLVRRMRETGLIEVLAEQTYRHRFALDGRPLPYVGIVGRKTGQIPDTLLAALEEQPPE